MEHTHARRARARVGAYVALAITASVLLLAAVPTAHGADLCVGTHPSCPGGATSFDGTAAGLQSAFTTAQTNGVADVLYIGTGIFDDAVNNDGFDVTSTHPLEIIGNGPANTVLRSDDPGQITLAADFDQCAAGSCIIRNLRVELNGTPGVMGVVPAALELRNGIARHVEVAVTDNPPNAAAVLLRDSATIEESVVTNAGVHGYGINVVGASATVRDTDVIGTDSLQGLLLGNAPTIERVTVRGYGQGIRFHGGSISITDSVIDLGSRSGARGVIGRNYGESNSVIIFEAERVTIIGSGPFQVGVEGAADDGTESFVTTLANSIIHLTGNSSQPITCERGIGRTASVTASYLAHDPSKNDLAVGPATCTSTISSTIDVASAPPTFVDAATFDYRPRHDSPLIDAGDPATTPGAGELDRRGLARRVDGNDDGTARVDVGALEYQHLAPTGLAASGPAVGGIGLALTFTGTAATDPDGDPITYQWAFSDGGAVGGLAATHTFSTGGAKTATLTATDVTGLTATSQVMLQTRDLTKPVLGTVTSTKRPFMRGRSGFARAATGYAGPVLRSTVSEPVLLRVTLVRVGQGKRTPVRGLAVVRNVAAGAVRLRFGGRFGGRILPSGRYSARIRAVDAAGNRSAARSVTFQLR